MDFEITNLESMLKQFARFRKMYAKACLPFLSKENFTPSELDILIFLSKNKSINTSKELGYYLEVSKGLIARSVESLIKRGMVYTQEDTMDKRIQHLYLSEKSTPIVNLLNEKRQELNAVIMKGISEEERVQMNRLLMQINLNVENIMKEEDLL